MRIFWSIILAAASFFAMPFYAAFQVHGENFVGPFLEGCAYTFAFAVMAAAVGSAIARVWN